ncbi:MAG: carbohydrate-binding module family 20 domain-containing protein [Saprospiraceae bacterium]
MGKAAIKVQFSLLHVRIPKHLQVGVVGSTPALGEWDVTRAVALGNTAFPRYGSYGARPAWSAY